MLGLWNETKGRCLPIMYQVMFWHAEDRATIFWTPQLYIQLLQLLLKFVRSYLDSTFVSFCGRGRGGWLVCTSNCTFWLHVVFQHSIISQPFNKDLYNTVFPCMEIMVLSVPLIHQRTIQQIHIGIRWHQIKWPLPRGRELFVHSQL